MRKLDLGLIKKSLNEYDRIVVTGPPRSGTTISGIIIANELKYKFIDESWYDANNPKKFMALFTIPREMVIHTTAFLRELASIGEFLKNTNTCVVLIKRPIKDILESFENSKKFKVGIQTSHGVYTAIDDEAQEQLWKAYGGKCENLTLPEAIYNYFYSTMYRLDQNSLFYMNYDDLKNHKLFVNKKERRNKFKHIKQVHPDNPYYLVNQRGIMVL